MKEIERRESAEACNPAPTVVVIDVLPALSDERFCLASRVFYWIGPLYWPDRLQQSSLGSVTTKKIK